MYLPLHNENQKTPCIRISFKGLYIFAGSLPLAAFFVCIVITMYKDFKHANNTHCNVPNIFPSISAAIGNYSPQIYIWQLAIYIHAPARFLTIYLRFKYYENVICSDVILFIYVAVYLNVMENISLLGLTYWTSSLYYPTHELFFKTFIATSIFYMLIVCVLLQRHKRKIKDVTIKEKKSLLMKWRFFTLNVVSFAFAAYFFIRHNRYCEPYMYSLFGFSEYIVVISNMSFHLTTIYDFHRKQVVISKNGIHLH